MLAIINDLLDFSKIEAGRLELETLSFDIRDTVHASAQLCAEQAKGLRLTCDVLPNIPPILRNDPGRLRRMNNQSHRQRHQIHRAGPCGGSGHDRRATPALPHHDGLSLRFTVSDSGVGLTADLQGRHFQAFTQADSSTTRQYGGTGLGLAICKQLAQLMGGMIGVDSKPGRDSTFWFTARFGLPIDALPIFVSTAEASPQAQQMSEPAEMIFPLKGTVLLADDNLVNQQVAESMVEGFGCQVDLVANGWGVLEALLRRPYDLVVMDCQMPEMDGLEATRRIRAGEASRDASRGSRMPIIATTAHVGKRDRAACLAIGMDAVLPEPVSRDELRTLLAKYLPQIPADPPPGPSESSGTTQVRQERRTPLRLNRHVLDQLRAVQPDSQTSLIQRVISLYCADSPGLLVTMRAALRQDDASALERAAHSLKSGSAALGATDLAELCRELEPMGRDNTLAQAEALVARTEPTLTDTRQALIDYLEQPSNNRLAGTR